LKDDTVEAGLEITQTDGEEALEGKFVLRPSELSLTSYRAELKKLDIGAETEFADKEETLQGMSGL
jgi:hypothetical protein